jgi:hypothetical protein
MKEKIFNLAKNYSSSKFGWNKLKNTRYTPNKNEEKSIVFQDGEFEFKYTRQDNKIIKQLSDRRLEGEKEELNYPKSEIDEKAFDYFIKQDQNGYIVRDVLAKAQHVGTEFNSSKMLNMVQRNPFATLVYKGEKVQVNSFKGEGLLLSRIQKVTFDSVTTPALRIGDKALLTNQELSMQYDLYCVEQGIYKQLILSTSKLKNTIEAATHFTGMVKTNDQGEVLFETSKEGKERPKTEYRSDKGKFVSMESHDGNTASLEYIVYKTQKNIQPDEGYELIFIPKNHEAIKQIVNICEALLTIKNTSTQDPEILDLILKKHGVSNKEIVVELINEIDKNDVSHGIFRVDAKEFISKNPELTKFIMTKLENFLDENSSYKLKVLEEKDSDNEPILEIFDELYEDPCKFEVKSIGTAKDLDLNSDSNQS